MIIDVLDQVVKYLAMTDEIRLKASAVGDILEEESRKSLSGAAGVNKRFTHQNLAAT